SRQYLERAIPQNQTDPFRCH
ncbi:hypothetical protein VEx25_2015, partial [Vibrio antiquarius]